MGLAIGLSPAGNWSWSLSFFIKKIRIPQAYDMGLLSQQRIPETHWPETAATGFLSEDEASLPFPLAPCLELASTANH